MITNSRIIAIALIAVLVGGSLGAIAMRSSEASRQSTPVATTNTVPDSANLANNSGAKYNDTSYDTTSGLAIPTEFKSAEEQTAYKVGFADGFQAATERRNGTVARPRVASNSSSSRSQSRRVYYDYNQRNGRTFWQKHRDKLTMAMGTGGGAILGGLIGGKKGAGIGALAGLGGSALYTYKLRNRNPR
jgi:hypothetical protein